MSNGGLVGAARPPARAPEDRWRLEPHICRLCHSRLASRSDADAPAGHRLYQCTNCGAEAHGHTADCLCCCGMKVRRPMRNGASGWTLVDAGIRCHENPTPTPEFPSLFVATEGK